MGYKMKSNVDSLIKGEPVIVKKNLAGDVHGETLNDGTIVINKNLSPIQQKIAISHEKVHVDQLKRGDLSYDDDFVYWKGKKYPRSSMKEGAKNLPWEKEAYNKQKKK
jgi:hypothetical protein